MINKVQCLKCKDIIESKHRHDFVRCKCGLIYTDGGQDYIRRGGDFTAIIELGDTSEETKKNNSYIVAAWEMFND